MANNPKQSIRHSFYDVARQLQMLDEAALETLEVGARRNGVESAEYALTSGLLTPVQYDIIQTMRRPNDVVPGYEILEVAGQGGMGVVFRARQTNLDRIVAIKTLLLSEISDPSLVVRFELEARTVANLQHPNIVIAHDFGRHAGRLFLVMEYIDGYELASLIRQEGRLSEQLCWGLLRQAAAGLAHADGQDVVHRDVKPANLLLQEPPEGTSLPDNLPMVRITDFGLAHLQNHARGGLSSGRIVGSPYYMAPEQFEPGSVDRLADIYSLGATAFEMLSGEPPFTGKTLSQIVAAKVAGEQVQLPVSQSVSSKSAELVLKLMATRPADRLQNYEEVISCIDGLEDIGSPVVMPQLVVHADSDRAPTQILSAPKSGRIRTFVRQGGMPLLMLSIAVLFAVWPWIQRTEPSIPRSLVPNGPARYLFDGENLQPWLASHSGQWNAAENSESGRVLAGTDGLVRRRLRLLDDSLPEHYVISLLVDIHEAAAVDIRFGIPSNAASLSRLVVRMTRKESVLGELDQYGFEAMSAPLKFDPNSPAVHAIAVERQPAGWVVLCNGRRLGSVTHNNNNDELPEFELLAAGGTAWFSDITLESLSASNGLMQ